MSEPDDDMSFVRDWLARAKPGSIISMPDYRLPIVAQMAATIYAKHLERHGVDVAQRAAAEDAVALFRLVEVELIHTKEKS